MRLSVATQLPFDALADLPPAIIATYLAVLAENAEQSKRKG